MTNNPQTPDLTITPVFVDIGDKTTVDFDPVDGKTAQVGYGGMARAKIIQINAKPMVCQRTDVTADRVVVVLTDHTLQHFDC
jgi:hypothetical protein